LFLENKGRGKARADQRALKERQRAEIDGLARGGRVGGKERKGKGLSSGLITTKPNA